MGIPWTNDRRLQYWSQRCRERALPFEACSSTFIGALCSERFTRILRRRRISEALCPSSANSGPRQNDEYGSESEREFAPEDSTKFMQDCAEDSIKALLHAGLHESPRGSIDRTYSRLEARTNRKAALGPPPPSTGKRSHLLPRDLPAADPATSCTDAAKNTGQTHGGAVLLPRTRG